MLDFCNSSHVCIVAEDILLITCEITIVQYKILVITSMILVVIMGGFDNAIEDSCYIR